jgi:malonate-semialdehyde dehydrogenase (acetylating)/methylmalonate-semialdehyde dehydrogenase
VFRYQQLIKENLGEIAKLITVEQGKTLPDAEGDVMRGLQVERYPVSTGPDPDPDPEFGSPRFNA